MLRISIAESSPVSSTLLLEGRVIGPWVNELSNLCLSLLRQRVALTLDLTEVSFVDGDGLALFRNLRGQRHVVLKNCSPLVAEQLKE
jgi:anti-anti-sigma regulatory factor